MGKKQKLKCDEYPCDLVKEYEDIYKYPDLDEKTDSYRKLCKAIDKCPKRVLYKGLKFCRVESEWG